MHENLCCYHRIELSSQTTTLVLRRHISDMALLSVVMRFAIASEEAELALFSTPTITGKRRSEYGLPCRTPLTSPSYSSESCLTYAKLQHKQRCSILRLRKRSTSISALSEPPSKKCFRSQLVFFIRSFTLCVLMK